MVPDYLQDLKPEKTTPGRYMFHNKDEFVPPEWRLRTYQKSVLPFAVSLWNSLEEDTRTISNYEFFKETLICNVCLFVFVFLIQNTSHRSLLTHINYTKHIIHTGPTHETHKAHKRFFSENILIYTHNKRKFSPNT